MYEESVAMSAASMPATSNPISPAGTVLAKKIGMACAGLPSGTTPSSSVASAAMPHTAGNRNWHTKKKLVVV